MRRSKPRWRQQNKSTLEECQTKAGTAGSGKARGKLVPSPGGGRRICFVGPSLMSEWGRAREVPEGGEGAEGSAESLGEGKGRRWGAGGGVILLNLSCSQLWGCKLMRSERFPKKRKLKTTTTTTKSSVCFWREAKTPRSRRKKWSNLWNSSCGRFCSSKVSSGLLLWGGLFLFQLHNGAGGVAARFWRVIFVRFCSDS